MVTCPVRTKEHKRKAGLVKVSNQGGLLRGSDISREKESARQMFVGEHSWQRKQQ